MASLRRLAVTSSLLLLFVMTASSAPSDAYASTHSFITIWKTTGANESITIPVGDASGTYTVNWGDGTISTGVTGDQTHQYAVAGSYTVRISGNFEQIYLDDDLVNAKKLQSIEQWGDIQWSTMASAFSEASDMVYNAVDSPNLSNVTDMSRMFGDASSFNGDISDWDVSSVTDMSRMFYFSSFNGDVSDWDVSSVTDMSYLFYSSPFNGDVSDWDVSSVTDMSRMFYSSPFNGDVSDWDVSSVTDMSGMFYSSPFNGDVSDWDVSLVTDMRNMFWTASSFNGDVSGWDVSLVTDMSGMFLYSSFNGSVSDWDVSSVDDMSGMFLYSPFNGSVSSWDVSSVTDMSRMFLYSSFNGDVSDWDVSSVTDMSYMLGHTPFNGDVSDWDVSSVTDTSGMFQKTSFNGDVSDWDVSSVTDMSGMFWEISSFNGDVSDWDVSSVTDMSYLFYSSPFNGDVSDWDVSLVTDMPYLFYSSPFNGDVSDWDVSSVTDMSRMFSSSSSSSHSPSPLNGDVSDWDVSSVTDMSGMFGRSPFNGDISNWDVSSVTDMSYMFSSSSFNGDVSDWDVSSVDDMSGMFYSSSFNGDVSDWDVSSVTNMRSMFGSSSFNGNLGNWYITLANTSIPGVTGTVGKIATQNAFLTAHRPIYSIGSGGDSEHFEIRGTRLALMTNPDTNPAIVNITSANGFGTSNSRIFEITTSSTVTDNTSPRIASIKRSSPAVQNTDSQTLVYKVTFSEDVTGVNLSDFTLSPGSVGGGGTGPVTTISGSGSVYYVTVFASQDGTYNLDLISSGHGIEDAADNNLTNTAPTTGTDHTYTVSIAVADTTAPTLASIERSSPAAQNTDSQELVYKVTFSEDVTGVGATDFVLSPGSVGGGGAGPVATISGSSSVYYVTVSASTDGTYNLDLISSGHGIEDAADNNLTNTAPTTGTDHTYTVSTAVADTTAPTLASIERSSPAAQNTDRQTLVYKVTFSEDVTGVGTTDFVLSPGSTGGGSGNSTTGPEQFTKTRSPSLAIPYSETVSDTITVPDSGNATSVSVAVDISHTYIGDLKVDLVAPDGTLLTLHNRAGGSDDDIDQTYTPSFGNVSIAGDWTLKINDNYDADTGTLNSWTLTINHTSTTTTTTTVSPVTGVSGSGDAYYVTVSASTDGTYNLDLISSGHGIEDAADNSLTNTAPTTGTDHTYTVSTAVADTTAPTLASIERSSPAAQNTDRQTLVYKVTFSEDVTGVGTTDFVLSPGSTGGGSGNSTTGPEQFTKTRSPSLAIPYSETVSDTITVPDSGNATSVSVAVDISHTYIGDLKVDLVAPDGTLLTLHNRAGGSDDNIDQTYTPSFGNVSIAGDWTLKINDNYDADTGTLNSWTLTINHTSTTTTTTTTTVSPVTGVSGSGDAYYVTVSASTDGTYNLDLISSGHGIEDAADNNLTNTAPTTGTDHTYTVSTAVADTTAPTLASIERSSPAAQNTDRQTLVYKVTFSEDVTGVNLSDFVLSPGSVGGGGAGPVATISGSSSVYYVTVSASTDGTYNLDLISSGHGIEDAADNSLTNTAPTTGTDHTYTVSTAVADTTAPTLASIERSSPAAQNTDRQTLVYKVTFSEDVTGVGTTDFVLSPGSTGGGSGNSTTGPEQFTKTRSPSLAIPYSETVSDTITVPDSGNATSVSVAVDISHTYIGDLKVDLVAPDGTLLTLHNRAGGSDDNIDQTYTPSFGNVSIAGDWTLKINDNYDADTGTLNSWTLTINHTSTTTTTTTVSPVTGVSGSGDAYYVTVSASTDGTYNLDLISSGHGIEDAADNSLTNTAPTTGTDHTYTVSTAVADTTAPTLASIERSSPAAQNTDRQTLVYKVTFSEDVTGVGTTDFVLSPGSTGGGSGNSTTGPEQFTKTRSPSLAIPYSETVSDTITVPDSGNATSVSVAVDISHTYIGDLKVDLVAPDGTLLTLHNRAGGSDDNIDQTYTPSFGNVSIAGDWTLKINDNYDADTGTLNSWTLTINHTSTTTTTTTTTVSPVTGVSGSGDAYYVTVSASTDGTYNLDLISSGHGIEDAADNNLTNTAPTTGTDHTYTVSTAVADTTAPTLASIERSSPAAQNTDRQTLVYKVTFSEDVTGVNLSDFVLSPGSVGGGGAGPVATISGSSSVYYVTVSASTDGTYNLDLISSGHGIEDAADNSLTNTAPTTGTDHTYTVSTAVADTTAPTLASIERSSPAAQNTDRQTLVYKVTFSEDVTGVGTTDFVLSPGSTGGGSGNSTTGPEQFTKTRSPSLAIPYSETVSDTITVPDSGNATSVSVAVDISHTYIGDLKVDLVAPDGTLLTLHNRAGGSDDNIDQTYTPSFGNVSIAGDWTLKINDNYDADTGTLNSWTLTINHTSTTTTTTTTVSPVTGVSGSGDAYYVTVSASTDGTYNLDLISSGHGIEDAADNNLTNTAPTTGTDHTYTVSTAVADTTAPTLASIERSSPAAQNTDRQTLVYKVTFSEDVTGVNLSDFVLSPGSVGGGGAGPVATISGSSSVYYVTVSASTDGTYNLDLISSGHGIEDAADNSLTNTAPTTGTDHTYTVSTAVADTTAPTLASIERSSPAAQNTDRQTLVYKVTFSEDVTGVGTTDFVLSPGSTGGGSGNSTTGPEQFTKTRSPSLAIPYSETVSDTITVPDSGNATSVSVAVDISHTYIGDLKVDLVAPDGTLLTLHNRAGGSDDNIDQTYTPSFGNVSIAGDWTLKINDNYDADTGTLNSWTLTINHTSTTTTTTTVSPVTGVSGSGDAYYVTVSASTDGTYNLDLISSGHGIEDAADNNLTNTAPTTGTDHTYTVSTAVADTTAPTLASIERSSPAAQNTDRQTLVYKVTFSEDVTGVNLSDFVLSPGSVGGGGAGPVATISGSSSVYYVTVSASTDGTYNLDLISSGHGIEDAADNSLTNTAPTTGTDHTYTVSTAVADTTAPTLASIERSSPAAQNTDRQTLVYKVTFSEDVTGVGTTDFVLSPGSTGGGSGNSTTGPEQFTKTRSPSLAIPYSETVSDTITVPDSGNATSVSVAVDISHTYIGDLKVDLVAPDGTLLTLHNRAGGSDDNIDQTYTPSFGNVSIAGDWTLKINDNYDADTGTLNSWTLTINHTSTTTTTTTTTVSPVTGVSGSGDAYYVTVSASTDGTYNLDLISSGHGIEDAADNNLTNTAPTTGTDHTYTVSTAVADTTAPTLASIQRYSPAAQNTDRQTLVYKVTFSEDVTGVGTTDFVLSPGNTGGGSGNSTTGPEQFTKTRSPSLAIPYSETVSDAITVPDSGNATSVSVAVDISHTYIGDLKVDLVAPDGTLLTLHNRAGGSDDNIDQTYTPSFGNVSIAGDWTLKINDNYDADTGTLNSWTLTINHTSTTTTTTTTTVSPVTGVSGSGDAYYVTVSASTDGTYNLDLISSGHGIEDAADNLLTDIVPTGADHTYTVTIS